MSGGADHLGLWRTRRGACLAAAALLLFSLTPVAGRAQGVGETNAASSQMLRQLYLSGMARLARGDPAGAITPFQVASEVAPELPQTHYSVALAMVIADFSQRERALPSVERALAVDPRHPLYNVLRVFADPQLSTLASDGSLYLTAAGASHLADAAGQLKGDRSAQNGRYLVVVLAAIERTGDARYPYRLAGFNRMIGQNGTVRLPQWSEAQAFGRLFTVSVPDGQFTTYEPRMIARLQNGLDSLSQQNQQLVRIKSRLQTIRGELTSEQTTPGKRG